MKRLTEKIGNTNCVKGCGSNCKYGFQHCRTEDWENYKTIDDVIDKLAEYNYEMGMENGYNKAVDDVIDKLAEYEDLEEQGRLISLPCKVGDTVYHVVQGRIVEVSNVDLFFLLLSVAENRFNNSVFLTKSEAEQKLKEMESD